MNVDYFRKFEKIRKLKEDETDVYKYLRLNDRTLIPCFSRKSSKWSYFIEFSVDEYNTIVVKGESGNQELA